ncbi:hypothetical protein [Planococcus koreensis]|uniref:hypothetical protein n=1 Tax=Planococcus koreensis TaxID=112331 RepID=UPI0039FCED04
MKKIENSQWKLSMAGFTAFVLATVFYLITGPEYTWNTWLFNFRNRTVCSKCDLCFVYKQESWETQKAILD